MELAAVHSSAVTADLHAIDAESNEVPLPAEINCEDIEISFDEGGNLITCCASLDVLVGG